MNGGAWGVRNRGAGTYNPDCDFCENCWEHGHEAEDCCNPTCAGQLKYEAEEAEKKRLAELEPKQSSAHLGIIAIIIIVIAVLFYFC